MLARLVTSSSVHVWSAFALSGENIAVVVDGTTWIAVTRLATVLFFRQSVGFGHALVAVASHYQSLASTVSEVYVASQIVHCSEGVACAGFTAFGVDFCQVPEAFLAVIASTSFYIRFAMASTGFSFALCVRNRVTNAIIEGTDGVTVTRFAGVRALDVFIWIAVEEGNTLFAVLTLGVMFAVIANSTTDPSGVLVNSLVKVAADCMVVAVTFCLKGKK